MLTASASSTTHVRQPMWNAASAKYSFGTNPAKMGMPTIDSAPIVNSTPETSSRWPAPRMSRISCRPPEAAISPAEDRKSMGFVSAWAKIWKNTASSAACVPSPSPM